MDYGFDTVHERRGTDSTKWARFESDVIPMPVADMDFLSPEPVRRAIEARAAKGFFGYSKAPDDFLEVVTGRLQRRYNWEVPPEAIIPIPGVIPGFNMGLRALTRPGESMVIQLPAYGPILNSNNHHGLVRHDAFLVRGDSGRYEVDWESFESAFDETTKVFVLCNPHNPVGRVFSPEELRRMAAICMANDAWIISDEIHCDLVLGDSRHTPIASLSPEIAARTITLMAPSKTFNLAGMKAAVAIIPDADLRAKFEGAKGGMVGAVNVMGYAAMTAAYRDCDAWLNALTAYLTANRDYLTAFVAERMPGVTVYPAEATYLAWLDCTALDLPDDDAFTWFLENARVGLGDGTNFGPTGKGFVRLNFGCPRPLLTEGLERLAGAVAKARS